MVPMPLVDAVSWRFGGSAVYCLAAEFVCRTLAGAYWQLSNLKATMRVSQSPLAVPPCFLL
jgi:hypothetical protein